MHTVIIPFISVRWCSFTISILRAEAFNIQQHPIVGTQWKPRRSHNQSKYASLFTAECQQLRGWFIVYSRWVHCPLHHTRASRLGPLMVSFVLRCALKKLKGRGRKETDSFELSASPKVMCFLALSCGKYLINEAQQHTNILPTLSNSSYHDVLS